MVKLPDMTLPTVTKIFQKYVDRNGDWRRPHLGASLIGTVCERSLWYTFRWCTNPNFSGRMLRLFDSGYQQEPRLVKDLRDVGVTVYELDPETGKQIHFEMFGGHYAGSCDAIAQGFEESKAWHVLEFKTASTKSYSKISGSGVQIAKPLHFYQMQQYMSWAGLDRAYYLCVNKDNDEIYGERVHLNKDIPERLEQKAQRVIFAQSPGQPISDNDKHPECRFCTHKGVCRGKLPEVNCRTCAMVTPEENGTWTCKGRVLCLDEQKAVHTCHVFIPALVGREPTDSDPEAGTISYGEVVNGPGAIPSGELEEWLLKVEGGEVEI